MEKENKNNALIYAITKENINRLINSIKLKSGKEDAIREIYGKGKFVDTKRALILFNIIDNKYQFTEEGRKVAYGDVNEIQKVWFEVINNYAAYANYIKSLIVSTNIKKVETVNAEDIINYWGMNNYGTSANNRREGVSAFASFVELAGIGEYKIGRHGASSRITFFLDKIKDGINKKDIKKNIELIIQPEEESNNIMSEDSKKIEERLKDKVEKEGNLYEYRSTLKDNVMININIDMSNWKTEDIEKILKILG